MESFLKLSLILCRPVGKSFKSLQTMENKENKSKITNAGRCKNYLEKNLKEFGKKDALRKKHSRLTLKSNKTANKGCKRKEREKKKNHKIEEKRLNRLSPIIRRAFGSPNLL